MLKRFAFGLIILLPLFCWAGSNSTTSTSSSKKNPSPSLQKTPLQATCGKKICIQVESTEKLLKEFPKLADLSRPLATMISPDNTPQKFVPDQVIFKPRDMNHLKDFLKRTGATVVRDGTLPPPPAGTNIRARNIPPSSGSYLLSLPLSQKIDRNVIVSLMELESNYASGLYRFNKTGLELHNFILMQKKSGEKVSPNSILNPAVEPDVMSRSLEESIGDVVQDAFTWPSVSQPDVNLQKAWQYIQLLQPPAVQADLAAGEWNNMVKVAFVDAGFKESPDLVSTHLQLDDVESFHGSECDFIFELPGCEDRDPIFDYHVMNEPSLTYTSEGGEFSIDTTPPLLCDGNWCWHGLTTHSVAAAKLNNNIGVAGSGGQVIYPALLKRGFDDYSAGFLIRYASSFVDIINLSFGRLTRGDADPETHDAIEDAIDQGVIVVAAAGNDGRNLDEIDTFPCEYDGVICAGSGATERWSGSNWGSNVDIFAPFPFKTLDSTNCNPVTPCGDMTVEELGAEPVRAGGGASATSYASPYIAGVIAMMKALKPSLTPAEAQDILEETASESPDPTIGRKVINPYKAIQRIMELEGLALSSDGNNSVEEATIIDTEPSYLFEGGSPYGERRPVYPPEWSVIGSLVPGNDEDWYTFVIPHYSSITLESLAANDAINGPFMWQLLKGGISLADSLSSPPPTEGVFLSPGNYSIKMFGGEDSFGNYRLRLSRTEPVVAPDRYDDETPSGEPRNDTTDQAAILRWFLEGFDITNLLLTSPAGLHINELNFDRSATSDLGPDSDYFLISLPEEVPQQEEEEAILGPECLTSEEREARGYGVGGSGGVTTSYAYSPGFLEILLSPFHPLSHNMEEIQISVFNGDTWTPLPTTPQASGVRIECPHNLVSSGRIGIKLTSTGAEPRNFYNLTLRYRSWHDEIFVDIPRWFAIRDFDLLAICDGCWFRTTDMRLSNPAIARQNFFPSRAATLELCKQNQCGDLRPEYYFFDSRKDLENFGIALEINSLSTLKMRLLGEGGVVVQEGKQLSDAKNTNRIPYGFVIPQLKKGKYLLEISGRSPSTYNLYIGQVQKEEWPFKAILNKISFQRKSSQINKIKGGIQKLLNKWNPRKVPARKGR